jgi:hypothetical protein
VAGPTRLHGCVVFPVRVIRVIERTGRVLAPGRLGRRLRFPGLGGLRAVEVVEGRLEEPVRTASEGARRVHGAARSECTKAVLDMVRGSVRVRMAPCTTIVWKCCVELIGLARWMQGAVRHRLSSVTLPGKHCLSPTRAADATRRRRGLRPLEF